MRRFGPVVAVAAMAAAGVLAFVLAWTDPVAAGDLRPSPDAVEYALGASQIAHGHVPKVQIGGTTAPPRYPFGVALFAAPFFWLPVRSGAPEPYRAVLLAIASAVLTATGVFATSRRAFGTLAGVLALLLVLLSPFLQRYARLIMAEMPTAAVFTLMALLLAGAWRGDGGPSGGRAIVGGGAIGLLVAVATWLRLANLQVLPAAAAGIALLAGRRWPRAVGIVLAGTVVGLLPPLAYQWREYGSPLRTGYHLWTPEWAGAGRPVFSFEYAFGRPALPSQPVQSNAVHYLAAWIGAAARGDAGEAIASPVHQSAAGLLAVAAVLGAWRGLSAPRSRAVTAFAAVGVASAFGCYALYYYQDVRYVAPWVPLWLLLAAAGIAWPFSVSGWRFDRRAIPALTAAAAAVVALAPGPGVTAQTPAWQRWVQRRPVEVPARLTQARALATQLPPDAWIISAIDGPFLDYYVLGGTQRRYLPLARGLEFVDKPPMQRVATAEQARAAFPARMSEPGYDQRPTVVVDRWSLEFAEGLPDFRREMEQALAGFDLWPGGDGAPRAPAYYALALPSSDHGVGRYQFREGEPLRGSGPEVYVFERGARRPIASLAAFAARGLRWEDVRRLPDRVLHLLPEGDPIA